MLPYLPFEIQTQIMLKLPVKPLLRFRSVSKAWKSMIDSSQFIQTYEGALVQHLLVVTNPYHYHDDNNKGRKYVSIVDDDTFPQQKVSPFIPELVNMLESFSIIGSSHGSLCLFGSSYCSEEHFRSNKPKEMAVLWNIFIGKAIAVVVPGYRNSNTLGFGVCRETNDPKIVKINKAFYNALDHYFMPWQVEVFSLSTGAWRSVVCNNIPRNSIRLIDSQVVIDGVMYWLAYDEDSEYMIISFDITREEFTQVDLPDSLARHHSHGILYISKLRNSLVVLQHDGVADTIVWMMEDGSSVSFTKLYTVYHPYAHLAEFRKNGEHIIKRFEGNTTSLAVYEPYTKRIESIGFDGTRQHLHVSSYMETLHLHDHLDSIVYYQGKPFVIDCSDPYRRTMKQTHMKVNLGNTR